MKNFKGLRVWKRGLRIAIDCFHLCKAFPSEQKFGLCIQITKAGSSIPANIAEGSSRSSDKDNCRFVEIALGSAFELETHLLVAEQLNYGDSIFRKNILAEIDIEQKMLIGYIETLKGS
jgi:four helix bundle protein